MCCCYNIFFFWKLLDFMRNMSGRGMWQCVIVPNWQRYSARPFQIFVVQIYVPYTFAFSFHALFKYLLCKYTYRTHSPFLFSKDK